MTFNYTGKKINKMQSSSDNMYKLAGVMQATYWWLAIFCLPDVIQNHVLDENCHRFQYKSHKQMHVDVVSRAVQLPARADKLLDDLKQEGKATCIVHFINSLWLNP